MICDRDDGELKGEEVDDEEGGGDSIRREARNSERKASCYVYDDCELSDSVEGEVGV